MKLLRSPSGSVIVAAVGLGLALAGLRLLNREPRVVEADVENRPIQSRDDGFVSSRACKACHPREYATWFGSYHRTMTQVATPEAVLGRFEGEVRSLGRVHGLSRRGNEFRVETHGDGEGNAPGGTASASRRVVMTTGSHHHQYYWLEGQGDRGIRIFESVWLIPDRRWIPIKDIFLQPAEDVPLLATGEWNRNCANCHATGPQPRWDGQGFDTEVAEMGIACEACHGPAEEHVRRHRNPWTRYRQHLGEDEDPSIVQPEHLPHRKRSEVCGQCHSIFARSEAQQAVWLEGEGRVFRPGGRLGEDVHVARNEEVAEFTSERMFWSDGMVRVAGREYNGLRTSPCYERGELTCLSCHTMHRAADDPRPLREWADDQLAPGMDGDAACLSCHAGFAADPRAHTHHPPDSSGSECQNCHMPHTTYGLRKAIRSHEISNPSVAESLETGRPNACNLCHLDRTLAWTNDALHEWYGTPPQPLSQEDQQVAAAVRWLLSGDAGQRALVAWSMGWEDAQQASGSSSWMRPHLAQLLADPYSAVRYVAYRSLRSTEGFADFEFDFLGGEAHRRAARRRAFQLWRQASGEADGARGDATLIDASGALRGAEFGRLLRNRDDRRVVLQE